MSCGDCGLFTLPLVVDINLSPSLTFIPRVLSISYSTGSPWQSQPNRRSTWGTTVYRRYTGGWREGERHVLFRPGIFFLYLPQTFISIFLSCSLLLLQPDHSPIPHTNQPFIFPTLISHSLPSHTHIQYHSPTQLASPQSMTFPLPSVREKDAITHFPSPSRTWHEIEWRRGSIGPWRC